MNTTDLEHQNRRRAREQMYDSIMQLQTHSRRLLMAAEIGARLTTPEPSDVRDALRDIREVEETLEKVLDADALQ